MIKFPCSSVGSTLSKAIEKLRTDRPIDLAQILLTKLARGFDHERDILGLESIFVENYGSRPFGDPQEHGNEDG